MPKKLTYELTEADLKTVKQAIAGDERAEVRQRAIALHLLHLGHAPAEVAEMLVVSQGTLYGWHKRWREGGLEGLANRRPSGRKAKATAGYVALLATVIEQEPSELGYDFTLWTVARLIEHMKRETGIHLRPTAFRALLKKHGYVYRRPKHDLKELQDPQARSQADEWLKTQKKRRWPGNSNSSLWTR